MFALIKHEIVSFVKYNATLNYFVHKLHLFLSLGKNDIRGNLRIFLNQTILAFGKKPLSLIYLHILFPVTNI